MAQITTYCAEHGDTPTNLRCSRCEKLVCPRCMVQAPVGIRCREHGQGRKVPTYQVSRGYLARGIGAGVAIGVAGGAALALVVLPIAWSIPFGSMIALGGFGYLLGEGISRATNRKRGRPLVIVAVANILIAFGIIYYFTGLGLSMLLGIGLSVYLAVTRLR
jgi:hypothetical protein